MKKEKLDYILKNKNDREKLAKISRRDLLSAGAIPFATSFLQGSGLFTLASLLGQNEAHAQATAWIPFLNVNLSGGASLFATFVPLDQQRNLLNSYSRLGLGTRPSTATYMGATVDQRSRFLEGIKSVVSAAAESRTKAVTLCTNIDADTAAIESLRPQLNVIPQLEAIGHAGSYFSSLVYGENFNSIRNFHLNNPRSQVAITSLGDMLNSLSVTGKLKETTFSQRQIASLFKAVTDLSSQYLASNSNLSKKSVRVNETLNGVNSLVSSGSGAATLLDPSKNSAISQVYNLTSSNPTLAQDLAISAVVNANLQGYATGGSIHLGGYDYHVPNRATSEAADYRAGVAVGKMIQSAHAVGKPVFIFLNTDGANLSEVSTSNDAPWTGDTRSSTQVIFAYHPSGVKKVGSDLQIGHFNNSSASNNAQLAELSTPVGDRSDYVGAAVLANYLSLHNRLNLFGQAAPSTLTPAAMNEVIKIST